MTCVPLVLGDVLSETIKAGEAALLFSLVFSRLILLEPGSAPICEQVWASNCSGDLPLFSCKKKGFKVKVSLYAVFVAGSIFQTESEHQNDKSKAYS